VRLAVFASREDPTASSARTLRTTTPRCRLEDDLRRLLILSCDLRPALRVLQYLDRRVLPCPLVNALQKPAKHVHRPGLVIRTDLATPISPALSPLPPNLRRPQPRLPSARAVKRLPPPQAPFEGTSAAGHANATEHQPRRRSRTSTLRVTFR